MFQALITVTTLGYSHAPAPQTGAGQLVLALTLVVGIAGLFGAGLVLVSESVVFVVTQRRRAGVKAANHVIVGGYGRIGRVVARELRDRGEQVVVVDDDDRRVDAARDHGFDAVLGDAREDEVLLSASVEDAETLVSTFSDDSVNVFVVVSAKAINPDLLTLSTASAISTADKLERVGADRVVATELAAGQMLARAARAPLAVDLLLGSIAESEFDECTIGDDAPFVGSTLGELAEEEPRIVVLAYRSDGSTEVNPDPTTEIQAGMTLLVHGPVDRMREFCARGRTEPSRA